MIIFDFSLCMALIACCFGSNGWAIFWILVHAVK